MDIPRTKCIHGQQILKIQSVIHAKYESARFSYLWWYNFYLLINWPCCVSKSQAEDPWCCCCTMFLQAFLNTTASPWWMSHGSNLNGSRPHGSQRIPTKTAAVWQNKLCFGSNKWWFCWIWCWPPVEKKSNSINVIPLGTMFLMACSISMLPGIYKQCGSTAKLSVPRLAGLRLCYDTGQGKSIQSVLIQFQGLSAGKHQKTATQFLQYQSPWKALFDGYCSATDQSWMEILWLNLLARQMKYDKAI